MRVKKITFVFFAYLVLSSSWASFLKGCFGLDGVESNVKTKDVAIHKSVSDTSNAQTDPAADTNQDSASSSTSSDDAALCDASMQSPTPEAAPANLESNDRTYDSSHQDQNSGSSHQSENHHNESEKPEDVVINIDLELFNAFDDKNCFLKEKVFDAPSVKVHFACSVVANDWINTLKSSLGSCDLRHYQLEILAQESGVDNPPFRRLIVSWHYPIRKLELDLGKLFVGDKEQLLELVKKRYSTLDLSIKDTDWINYLQQPCTSGYMLNILVKDRDLHGPTSDGLVRLMVKWQMPEQPDIEDLVQHLIKLFANNSFCVNNGSYIYDAARNIPMGYLRQRIKRFMSDKLGNGNTRVLQFIKKFIEKIDFGFAPESDDMLQVFYSDGSSSKKDFVKIVNVAKDLKEVSKILHINATSLYSYQKAIKAYNDFVENQDADTTAVETIKQLWSSGVGAYFRQQADYNPDNHNE